MTFGLRAAGAALLAGLSLLSGTAEARGCADFQIIGAEVRDTYDPYGFVPVIRFFTIAVRKLDDTANSVRFLLVDDSPRGGLPGFDEAGPPNYQVSWNQDRARQVFVWDVQTVNNLNGAFASLAGEIGRTTNVSFQFAVPRGQEAAAGTHHQPLSVRYRCYRNGEPVGGEYEQSDARLRLTLIVPRYISAFITGSGGTSGRIDFGDVSPASGSPTQGIKVTTIGTSTFNVRVDTDNGARLVPDGGGSGYGIGYAMRYGGVQVVPGDSVTCPRPAVPSGSVRDLDVTLRQEDISAVPAGHYRDTITLTFAPRDGVWPGDCAVTGNQTP